MKELLKKLMEDEDFKVILSQNLAEIIAEKVIDNHKEYDTDLFELYPKKEIAKEIKGMFKELIKSVVKEEFTEYNIKKLINSEISNMSKQEILKAFFTKFDLPF